MTTPLEIVEQALTQAIERDGDVPGDLAEVAIGALRKDAEERLEAMYGEHRGPGWGRRSHKEIVNAILGS